MNKMMILGMGALMATVASGAIAQSTSQQILDANTSMETSTPVMIQQTEMQAVPVGDMNRDGTQDYHVIETQTTVRQTEAVVPVPMDADGKPAQIQPETSEAMAGQAFDVIMPDGTKLSIADAEWWKDSRLSGYTRFWFDTTANAYRPVVEKDNSAYQKRENTWCTPEQSTAGKC